MLTKAPRPCAHLWHRQARGALMALCLWMAGAGVASAADTITSAHYSDPTTRYAHGVLGDDIEYGSLVITVDNSALPKDSYTDQFAEIVKPFFKETVITIRLSEDRVFEDLEPRLVDIDQNGTTEVIVVESQQDTGAQLAIYDARGVKIAATPHIGTRNRWLAPVGAADLDGDGQIEIAYIDRPHLAKTLRIWRYENRKLTEIATIPGLTNHKIGEDFISGGIRTCGERSALVLASTDWSRIIGVFYKDGWQTDDLGPLKDRKDLNSATRC